MKFKFLVNTAAQIKKLLRIDLIPVNAEGNATAFTDEQLSKIKGVLGDDFAESVVKGFNKELKDMSMSDHTLKAMKDEMDALLAQENMTAEELDALANGKGDDGNALTATMLALLDQNKQYKEKIDKLMMEPEGDTPAAIVKNAHKNMAHSATHLFASGHTYDAIENRPWNARVVKGGIKATDFNNNPTSIPLLQGDVEHFVRQNPDVIDSLFNDTDALPAEWDYITNVQDRISSAVVIAAEVVQGRSKGWAPKNDFHFDTETGQVYRKKMDITFDGYELQELENTWIGAIKKMDGSHPWKMSFVGFLLFELTKQQRADDRIAQINGIFSVNPITDKPGRAVNSQNGLRYLWYFYRDVKKKYKPYVLGQLTEANIVDKVEELIVSMPEEQRKDQGLEIQISDKWMKAYNRKAADGLVRTFITDQGQSLYAENYPVDRPNFKFQVLKDQTMTDFIGITYSKNVRVLEYKPEEKIKFTFTFDKRNMNIFADYRLGIQFKFVGTKTKAGDPKQFEKQMLWSNEAPVFSTEVSVPVFDNKTGVLSITYPTMTIDADWVTDITDVDTDSNFIPGQIIRITGNSSLPGLKNLKDNAVFDLAGNADYPLNTGGTITLFVNEDKTFKEITRTTTAPVAAPTDVKFTTTSIDASTGSIFRWDGTASTTALAGIINGVEGQTIKIYGKTAGVAFTLADIAGVVDVASNATLDASTEFVQLTKVDGIWRETNRSIA